MVKASAGFHLPSRVLPCVWCGLVAPVCAASWCPGFRALGWPRLISPHVAPACGPPGPLAPTPFGGVGLRLLHLCPSPRPPPPAALPPSPPSPPLARFRVRGCSPAARRGLAAASLVSASASCSLPPFFPLLPPRPRTRRRPLGRAALCLPACPPPLFLACAGRGLLRTRRSLPLVGLPPSLPVRPRRRPVGCTVAWTA